MALLFGIYMGRRDKSYSIDLHQQIYNRLTGMQAFGESKKEAMKDDEAHDKIFSYNTYQTYWKHCKYFAKWIKEEHPDCTTLKSAKKYVNEWLQTRVDQVDEKGNHLSAWTINTEEAAMNKLFHIRADDPDRFVAPKRHRYDIKRSRVPTERDKHFSVTNNHELITFCKGTGLRRAGVESCRGRDLTHRDEIVSDIKRIEAIPVERRTAEQNTRLTICRDAMMFTHGEEYFVRITEKGGRERLAPIVGPDRDSIVQRFKDTAPDEHVWQYVNKNADIHDYRGDYASYIYKEYARAIADIPYDKLNKGTKKMYQGDVYVCRSDETGKKLDRKAMLVASKALGHNRIDIVADNYIRKL